MTDKFKIRRFTGKHEDFHSWKREFMVIKDLDHIIEKDPPGEEVDGEVLEKYNKLNKKLYSYLTVSLDERTARALDVTHKGDGHKAWKELNQIFEGNDKLRMASLRWQ